MDVSKNEQPAMDRLCDVFQASARRWELIVYPSIFAFIILAAYGFYLVFSLTKDVHYLAQSVDTNLTHIAVNMQSVAQNVNNLTQSIDEMETRLTAIDGKMETMDPIRQEMAAIRQSIGIMNQAVHGMQWNTQMMSRDMNQIQKPMGFFNSFMPW